MIISVTAIVLVLATVLTCVAFVIGNQNDIDREREEYEQEQNANNNHETTEPTDTSNPDLDIPPVIVAQILYAGSIADAEYRSDWESALIECLTIDDWTFESLKKAVEREFGVSLDYNVPIQEYFYAISSEVNE